MNDETITALRGILDYVTNVPEEQKPEGIQEDVNLVTAWLDGEY